MSYVAAAWSTRYAAASRVASQIDARHTKTIQRASDSSRRDDNRQKLLSG